MVGRKSYLHYMSVKSLTKKSKVGLPKKVPFSGNEVFFKSIAMTFPVYAVSCFRLRKHHCQKFMSETARF